MRSVLVAGRELMAEEAMACCTERGVAPREADWLDTLLAMLAIICTGLPLVMDETPSARGEVVEADAAEESDLVALVAPRVDVVGEAGVGGVGSGRVAVLVGVSSTSVTSSTSPSVREMARWLAVSRLISRCSSSHSASTDQSDEHLLFSSCPCLSCASSYSWYSPFSPVDGRGDRGEKWQRLS